jgi:hypothetical protein
MSVQKWDTWGGNRKLECSMKLPELPAGTNTVLAA